MKEFPNRTKYQFYSFNNTIIALSHYKGKIIKGIAKCHPDDEFNLEKGKELAMVRCY